MGHVEWAKSWFNGSNECDVALALRIMGGGGGTSGGQSSNSGTSGGGGGSGAGSIIGDGTIDATSSFKTNRVSNTSEGVRRLQYQQRMAALLYRSVRVLTLEP